MTKQIVSGTIEKVRYTTGSFGEQYVTIDRNVYMAYWEIGQLKVGAKVEIAISPPPENCFVGNSQIVFKQPQAQFLRFLENDSASSMTPV